MPELNFTQARFNMIEQQVRPWEVLDQQVLDVMSQIPREAFVPDAYAHLAFADIEIPLAHNQVMMPPKLEGRVVQSLLLKPTDRVLEIGTGSGYVTALLAALANHVDTVDAFIDFVEDSRTKLAAHHIKNVTCHAGDAVNGWNTHIRYDAIILTGSVPILKPHWQAQLAIDGRLFAIVGQAPIMEAKLITRINEHEWIEDSLFETSIPAIMGAPKLNAFVF